MTDRMTKKIKKITRNTRRVIKRNRNVFKKVKGGIIITGATKYVKRYSHSLVDILMKFKIYRYTLKLKLIFVVVPLLVLMVLDNFVVAFVVATFDIFLCALLFSFTIVQKDDCLVNGNFDYGKYLMLRNRRETIVIITMTIVIVASILFGHFIFNDFVQHFVD